MGKQSRCQAPCRWIAARIAASAVIFLVATIATASESAQATAPVLANPAAALDPSFSSGGVLTTSFAAPPGPQEGRDGAVQPDGKIVLLSDAETTAGYAAHLSRYLANGEPDTTFGTEGSVALPSDGHDAYSALALDAEGRIVVAGSEPVAEWQAPDKTLALARVQGAVYRFLPNGSPDLTFGTGGKATITIPPPEGLTPGSASATPWAVLTTPDGGVTVGGSVRSICTWYSIPEFAEWQEEYGTFVTRLSPDGSPDSQFGSSGVVSSHSHCKSEPGAAPETFGGLAQPSSESVLALSGHPEDNTWRFRTYSSTGALSETQAPAEGQTPAQLVVLPDDDLLVGVFGSETLRRFTPQGVADCAFGTSGRVTIPSMACEFGPWCFAVLPDGRILSAGEMNGKLVEVRRYLADGTLDDSFGVAPWQGGDGYAWVKPTPEGESDTVNRLLIVDGRPLVIGAALVHDGRYPYAQTALTMFQADGGFSSNPAQPTPGEGPFPPLPSPPGESPSSSGPISGGTSAGAPYGSIPGGSNSGAGKYPTSLRRLTTSAIETALESVLNRSSLAAARLVKTGTYSLAFNAPEPGTLVVQWMNPNGQAGSHRRTAISVVVASGAETFHAAGRGAVALHLTAAGRRLLRSHHSIKLAATATFRPTSGQAIVRRGLIPLGRR